ncbi:MAG TPA: hypothetical protein VG053_12380 [Solirubrobacteraceae bacterium]|nr:hypothetical protein [Solirubrobacteraceae bacterium]
MDLPQGLLGDPTSVPRCVIADFARTGLCPASTQIGLAEIEFEETLLVEDIYNLVPEKGESAEIGIPAGGEFNFVLTGHVIRSDGEYALTVISRNLPMRGYTRFKISVWGVPADPSHDPERGLRCGTAEVVTSPLNCEDRGTLTNEGGEHSGVAPVPFWSMPSDCADRSRGGSVLVDSWEEPGHFVSAPEARLPQPTGCEALSFGPLLEVLPETTLADSPVGLGVSLKVPQPEVPGLTATPPLRDASVTLPAGMSVSPGVVDGIRACNETGPEGINLEGPESEQLGPDGESQLAPGHCPDASTVGTAEATTPLLPEPVKGHLYLARPLCGGTGQEACTEQDALDGRLYRLYLELGGKGALADAGVNIKAAGVVSADPATGQLTSTFTDNPQLPFSELKLRLNGGPRASLANPQACGEARTTSDFTPWSAPGRDLEGELVPGTPDANPFSFFTVTGCANPAGLNPGFTAGTVTPEAGIYTPFTLNISREDGEQDLAGVQVHTPPGLLGMLSSVTLCKEPEAQNGHCPPESKIGTTTVASGAGSHPFEISGSVYLTTGYEGAPFGLSIVTNAVAGPFNLGLVVVRARIDVNPETSALTVTSDRLPQIVFGVPLRLKRITVNIDRPGFMFNPTNCGAPGQPGMQQVTANISGAQNAVADVSSSFAVGGCKGLAFKPSFTVSTGGRTSKADGASLDAKVSYPPGSMGSEANIASVKVELPKQLPSRLTTLQKACTAAQFEANPAGCPSASVVGIARASTPVLPVGLEGPVYFVSHGGEAFPSLIVVLQGDGVRVDLTGATFISKAGITSSTFKTVPDVPVNSFELFLPQGPYSALTANGNLCNLTTTTTIRRRATKRVHGRIVHHTVITHRTKPASLVMPSEFVAQNGAVLKQSTNIEITGCATTATEKAKTAVAAAAARHRHRHAGVTRRRTGR